jgi:hypothetical protein
MCNRHSIVTVKSDTIDMTVTLELTRQDASVLASQLALELEVTP